MLKIRSGKSLKEMNTLLQGLDFPKTKQPEKKKKKGKKEESVMTISANPQEEEEDAAEISYWRQEVEKYPYPNEKPIYAKRFDFAFNNHYYIHNIDVSESGDTIYARTAEQGRVVSKAPI